MFTVKASRCYCALPASGSELLTADFRIVGRMRVIGWALQATGSYSGHPTLECVGS